MVTTTVLTAIMIQPMVGMLAGSAGVIFRWVSIGSRPRKDEPATPTPSIQPNSRERSWYLPLIVAAQAECPRTKIE